MFGDIGKMFKLVSELKTKLPEMKAKLELAEFTAQAGDGAVQATVKGNMRVSAIEIRKEATAHGMTNLRQDGLRLVREGRTTLEEVLRATKDDSFSGNGNGNGETAPDAKRLKVSVCVGTSCFVRGAQTLLSSLPDFVQDECLMDQVELEATFCFERCDRGPTVRVGSQTLEHCTLAMACEAIQSELARNRLAPAS